MKRNLILLILVVILLAVGGYLFLNSSRSTISDQVDEYAFAVKDTASITKIIIRDKSPAEVILVRENNSWVMNDGLTPRKDALEVLLETIYRMEMRSYVPEQTKPSIRKRLDVFGTHVEIYDENGEIKSFTVGTETPDQLGTYMVMDGSNNPFAVFIPGFNGYLNTRFFTSEDLWRSRVIWGFDNLNIKEIVGVYPYSKGASFKITTTPELALYNGNGDQVLSFSQESINTYLAAFRNAQYEGVIVPSDKIYSRMDSVSKSVEVVNLTVTSKSGKSVNLKGYQIKAAPETFESNGDPMVWDPDRMYGIINDKDYVLIQYYGLQFVLKGLNDFTGEY